MNYREKMLLVLFWTNNCMSSRDNMSSLLFWESNFMLSRDSMSLLQFWTHNCMSSRDNMSSLLFWTNNCMSSRDKISALLFWMNNLHELQRIFKGRQGWKVSGYLNIYLISLNLLITWSVNTDVLYTLKPKFLPFQQWRHVAMVSISSLIYGMAEGGERLQAYLLCYLF